MIRYYKKEVPESKLYLSVGRPLMFDFIDINAYGYLATEDGFIIAELSKCILAQKGGVVEIEAEEYQQFLAQKKSGSSTAGFSRQRQTIGPSSVQQRNRESVVDPADVSRSPSVVGISRDGSPAGEQAGLQRPESLSVTKEFVKPRVGRIEMTA